MSERVDRTGLYIMVIIILLNSCDDIDRSKRIEQKVNQPCTVTEVKK